MATCEMTSIELDDGNLVRVGRLPDELMVDAEGFSSIWEIRPTEPRMIMAYGKWIEIRRGQKAYGHDYSFSGQTAAADPVPPWLEPYQRWACETIDPRLNGLLLNWYDGAHEESIGPHRDKTPQLVVGSPIVTASLGEERIFRLTREEHSNGKRSVVARHDLVAAPGSLIEIPWATNLVWKHAVPSFKRYRGRRISITLRCFT